MSMPSQVIKTPEGPQGSQFYDNQSGHGTVSPKEYTSEN